MYTCRVGEEVLKDSLPSCMCLARHYFSLGSGRGGERFCSPGLAFYFPQLACFYHNNTKARKTTRRVPKAPASPAARLSRKVALFDPGGRVASDVVVLKYGGGLYMNNMGSGQLSTFADRMADKKRSPIFTQAVSGGTINTCGLEHLISGLLCFSLGDVILVWSCFLGTTDASYRQRIRKPWQHMICLCILPPWLRPMLSIMT